MKGFTYFISHIFGCRDRCTAQAGEKQRVRSDYWPLLFLDSLGLRF